MELLLFVFEMKEGELLSKKWCEMLFAYYDKRFGAYELRATTGFRYACGLGVVLLLTLSMTIPCFIVWLVNPEIPKGTMPSMSTVTRMEGVKLKEARPQPRQFLPNDFRMIKPSLPNMPLYSWERHYSHLPANFRQYLVQYFCQNPRHLSFGIIFQLVY